MPTRAVRLRLAVAVTAALLIVVPLGWLWWSSLIPSTYSMDALGYADFGGGPGNMPGHMHGMAQPDAAGSSIDIATLTGPGAGTPAVNLTLVAEKRRITLAGGRVIENGYTVNGRSPGPPIVAHEGDLIQVTLVNKSVPEGVSLHWHGLDVPNAEDGVAGVTQDAVLPGGSYVYRFRADHAGTYWYHSHQVSDQEVRRGLFGSLVVLPRVAARPAGGSQPADVDVTVPVHTYDGITTVAGVPGQLPVQAAAGKTVRVRVINTDDSTLQAWTAGVPYRMIALDGRDWHEPGLVTGKAVRVAAGGRADLQFTMPEDGSPVRVGVGAGTTSVLVSPPPGSNGGATRPEPSIDAPATDLDLLSYGTKAPLDFDPTHPDRRFTYSIGRRPGFINGRPGLWWSIDGHLYPDVPMFHVTLGDVVRMTIENHSGQVHPMHLHGHHLLVLSRNGKLSTGSPWWSDTLDVADGQSYEVAFVADNPGIWADHCHNLLHATQGLVTHLEYTGYRTHFEIGGKADNTLG